jgi:NAD(P)-dependent dehydrogenase (short-subunit alcohol dehydrogenase family)
MTIPFLQIAGGPGPIADRLAEIFGSASLFTGNMLVNADPVPDTGTIVARCRAFAAAAQAEALIVTILPATPAGLADFPAHAAAAALWAFTRQAALEWAPRRIRVNAIGLGTSPATPFEPAEAAGRAAAAIPAPPASIDDIAATLRAIAAWPSMTGQIIRLGA